MKQKDVTIGDVVLTKVSGVLTPVRVASARVSTRVYLSGRTTRLTRFVVIRVDNGAQLPKPRSAAALRVE